MKTKTFLTIALLVFAASSVAYLMVGKPYGLCPSAQSCSIPSAQNTVSPNSPAEVQEDANAFPTESPRVLVYYFHGSRRCMTCKKLEAYSEKAVSTGFAEAIKQGRLGWAVVNIDQEQNKHFIQDYQLHTKSLVIVQLADGKQQQWKNLTRIWELVHNEEDFIKYVQQEIVQYLGAK
ncbi:MAG: nitrophenyl compound nitroreductase subunit ArsF family protein [Planctomycetota bacterium]